MAPISTHRKEKSLQRREHELRTTKVTKKGQIKLKGKATEEERHWMPSNAFAFLTIPLGLNKLSEA